MGGGGRRTCERRKVDTMSGQWSQCFAAHHRGHRAPGVPPPPQMKGAKHTPKEAGECLLRASSLLSGHSSHCNHS